MLPFYSDLLPAEKAKNSLKKAICFRILFLDQIRLEFFHQRFKCHHFTPGGVFDRKTMIIDLRVGLLFVQKFQKVKMILIFRRIQILISS